MWNEFLKESKTDTKFENTPVIVLGSKHSGKRSLIDALFDVSKTTLYGKKNPNQSENSRIKIKGNIPVVDYAYLNVLDLTDVEYRTHSKLEVYMVEDPNNQAVYAELAKKDLLSRAITVIMLDFTSPWKMMDQISAWVKFLYEVIQRAEFTKPELDALAAKVTDVYKRYKQPQIDQNGKLKAAMTYQAEEQEVQIPIPEGVLKHNLRMPLLFCINKADLKNSAVRDDSIKKTAFIQYHLRKLALQYGASLVYTSIKNNTNIQTLYQYILHRAYNMPLSYKPEIINEEAIFIPLGFDNFSMLEDFAVGINKDKSFETEIVAPQTKKQVKQEVKPPDQSIFEQYLSNPGMECRPVDAKQFFQKMLDETQNTSSQQNSSTSGNTDALTRIKQNLNKKTAMAIKEKTDKGASS